MQTREKEGSRKHAIYIYIYSMPPEFTKVMEKMLNVPENRRTLFDIVLLKSDEAKSSLLIREIEAWLENTYSDIELLLFFYVTIALFYSILYPMFPLKNKCAILNI